MVGEMKLTVAVFSLRIAVGNGAPDCPWKKVIRKTGR